MRHIFYMTGASESFKMQQVVNDTIYLPDIVKNPFRKWLSKKFVKFDVPSDCL